MCIRDRRQRQRHTRHKTQAQHSAYRLSRNRSVWHICSGLSETVTAPARPVTIAASLADWGSTGRLELRLRVD
eukprot:2336835-Rhodomonas_salina.2